MKLDVLETHDRLIEFSKQQDYISKGCQDCINSRPEEYGNHCFYIFAHCRTADDGYTKRLIWMPYPKKPKAQTNSMLFKAYPPSDNIKIIWMIPPREMWDQYKKDLMLQNQIVYESIQKFKYNRNMLEEREGDDFTDEEIKNIRKQIAFNAIAKRQKLAVS